MHLDRMLLLTLLMGCPAEEPATEAPPAEDKCPKVSMDALWGQWILVDGKRGDHTHRLELRQDGPTMWLVDGGFTRRVMKGEKRADDYVFTEVPSADKAAKVEAGAASLLRMFVKPDKAKCALRVLTVEVSQKDGAESEKPRPGFKEYLPFPDHVAFNFRPCDDTLFLGDAAKDWKKAEAQLGNGGADPSHPLGEAIPVGAWSVAAEDGDAACTYDMDLFFDDRPVKDKQGLPAGAVQGDRRQWLVDAWSAPYSGNHHFEAWRYKTCDGGSRELVAVSCLEAVLQ